MPHTPPPSLALDPTEDEPDWYAMLNALAVPPGQVARTAEPRDGSSWTWYLVGTDLLLHFEVSAVLPRRIRAEASGPATLGCRASLTQHRPLSATQVWTLCVLAGLLPERSGA